MRDADYIRQQALRYVAALEEFKEWKNSKYVAECIGGPDDGEFVAVGASGLYMRVLWLAGEPTYHWYRHTAHGRVVDGAKEYRDRYVYLGTGTAWGPTT